MSTRSGGIADAKRGLCRYIICMHSMSVSERLQSNQGPTTLGLRFMCIRVCPPLSGAVQLLRLVSKGA